MVWFKPHGTHLWEFSFLTPCPLHLIKPQKSFITDQCSFQIVFKMVEENPRDVGHEMDGLSVFYGDESLPRLYENSRISSDQNPGHKGKYTIFFLYRS